jgi:uncharacterized protein (TIGR00255 family)
MIASMTGYGRGSASSDSGTVTVELRSLNSRQREVRVRLPQPLFELEAELRELVQRQIGRGRVDVYVSWERGSDAGPTHGVNIETARAMVDVWRKLQSEIGLPDPPRAEAILRLPGVIEPVARPDVDLEAARALLGEAAGEALAQFGSARSREGERLAADLRARSSRLSGLLVDVRERLDAASRHQAEALRERVRLLLDDLPLDESRLAQEVALLAQRADATEELVRLDAHVERLRALLAPESSEVGREVEFVLQEIRREVNTLGAKASDPEVDALVLAAKSELEKIREQAANLE